jgi:hypothetical protein
MPYSITPIQMKLYLTNQKTVLPSEMIKHILDYLYRPVHPTATMIYNKYEEYYYFDTQTYSGTPYFVLQRPSNQYGMEEYISFHEWVLDYHPKFLTFLWEEYGEM